MEPIYYTNHLEKLISLVRNAKTLGSALSSNSNITWDVVKNNPNYPLIYMRILLR